MRSRGGGQVGTKVGTGLAEAVTVAKVDPRRNARIDRVAELRDLLQLECVHSPAARAIADRPCAERIFVRGQERAMFRHPDVRAVLADEGTCDAIEALEGRRLPSMQMAGNLVAVLL